MARTVRIALAMALAGSALAMPAGAPAGHEPVEPSGLPDGGPALPPLPSHVIDGSFRTWQGEPGWIAGQWVISERELIVTDHPFDDRGADLDGSDGRSDNPAEQYPMLHGANAATGSAGNYAYPPDPAYANNAADIIQTRFAVDEDHWYVLVVFNALLDPTRTAVEVRLRDEDQEVEPVTLLATGVAAALDGVEVDVAADVEANTFEIRVPRAVYDPGTRWHSAFVAAGLWDPATATWLHPASGSGAAPYFDLAFTRNEPVSYWSEVKQSRIIAGTHPIADAEFVLPFLSLTPCGDDCPIFFGVRRAGPFVRVLHSGQDLGEGVELQTRYDQQEGGLGYKLYRSPYQPYLLYNGGLFQPGPKPLVLLLHFLGGNHMSYGITAMGGVASWAAELGAIVAMPLSRGEAGWYEGEAEIDVFEVWRDVARHYPVDPERIYVAGVSMGGLGAVRLGHLYPDQFAAAISWAGPPTPNAIWPAPAPVMWPHANPPMCDRDAPGCGYTLIDLIGNARNLPSFVVHGALDELVPFTSVEEMMERFDAEASPHTYVLYPTRRHETSFPASTIDRVREWLGDLPSRKQDPARVSYRILRALAQPEFGLTYDGAYWIGSMRLAEGASEGWIDADAGSDTAVVSRSGDQYGIDAVGPYRWRHLDVPERPIDPSSLEVSAVGLEAAAIDTTRLGWDPEGQVQVLVVTDHALELRLIGDFPPGVVADGADWLWDDGDLVLSLPHGPTGVTLNPGVD